MHTPARALASRRLAAMFEASSLWQDADSPRAHLGTPAPAPRATPSPASAPSPRGSLRSQYAPAALGAPSATAPPATGSVARNGLSPRAGTLEGASLGTPPAFTPTWARMTDVVEGMPNRATPSDKAEVLKRFGHGFIGHRAEHRVPTSRGDGGKLRFGGAELMGGGGSPGLRLIPSPPRSNSPPNGRPPPPTSSLIATPDAPMVIGWITAVKEGRKLVHSTVRLEPWVRQRAALLWKAQQVTDKLELSLDREMAMLDPSTPTVALATSQPARSSLAARGRSHATRAHPYRAVAAQPPRRSHRPHAPGPYSPRHRITTRGGPDASFCALPSTPASQVGTARSAHMRVDLAVGFAC